MRFVMLAVMLLMPAAALAQAGQAPYQPWGPRAWCIEGRIGGSFPNCSYYTYEQCRATAFADHRTCIQNPFYQPEPRRKRR
jgi:hypothetical protein